MTKNNLKRIAAPKKWDIKRKKIRFLKDQIETNIQKIDQIIGETNADS